ncbi:odorant receptor 45b-like [Anthonomus grandis grandis]|uniref:odorant receptor 45b-like n=1 Tax=Anthonomus grandis grandis TaxID=2921223 RepID=UPI002165BC04|nr:odorant receptor 45b-like [Anthonomus grandis grandis]
MANLFGLVRIMLIVAGLWPLEIPNVSTFWQRLYKLYYAFSFGIYVTFPFPFICALINDIENQQPRVLEEFSRLVFVIMIIFKMMIIRSQKIKDMIILLSSDEKKILLNKDRYILRIYQFHVGYCKKIIFFVAASLYVTGSINVLNGFFELYKWSKVNQLPKEKGPKPHLVPFWFPFNKDKYYVLFMTYEVWHIVQTLTVNGAVQALINAVMVFLRANLKILQYHIKNFDGNCNINSREDYIKCATKSLTGLILRHQQLIKWVKDLDSSFKNIFLIEYSVTSIQLATVLIQIIELVHIPFNGTFFIHCTLQLLAICWNANEIIIESSTGLLEALYSSNWFNQPKQISFLIYFMMIRCGRPLSLRIGPFGNMDLNAALSRVKLAYSCVSVLKA